MSNQVGQIVDPNDPWALATGSGYDETRFYMRSTDGKGHSENIQAKLSPAMVNELQALIHRGELPYRTVQDFIRDACVHRAKYLNDQLGKGNLKLDPIAAADALLCVLEQRREKRKLAEEMADQSLRECTDAIMRGNTGDALELIQYLDDVADVWEDITQRQIILEAVEKMRTDLRNSIRSRAHA